MTEYSEAYVEELRDEIESLTSDSDELYHRLGELEDEVADLRVANADLTARLAEHDPVSEDAERLSYGGTD